MAEVDKAGYAAQVIHPGWNETEGWENAQVLDSTKVTLRKIFDSRKQMVYEYAFGDGWLPSGDGSPKRQKASGASRNTGMDTFDLVAAVGYGTDQ